jgi:hypothetical protein
MADKKFGKKRVCGNCEIKFYDLNKESPLTCPQCKSEVLIEDNFSNVQVSQAVNINLSQNQRMSFQRLRIMMMKQMKKITSFL